MGRSPRENLTADFLEIANMGTMPAELKLEASKMAEALEKQGSKISQLNIGLFISQIQQWLKMGGMGGGVTQAQKANLLNVMHHINTQLGEMYNQSKEVIKTLKEEQGPQSPRL